MAVKYAQKQYKQNNILFTGITILLVCAVFLFMVGYFYARAESDATEVLHIQTKQIKDDIHLQIVSDRENLSTMASFASKLYRDGEGYGLLFESFKPIGLIKNIGILSRGDILSTKAGAIDLSGRLSFEEEKERCTYISGRVPDLTRDDYEMIRSAVPIVVNGETVGILYGAIDLSSLKDRYNEMAQTLDAQLFVYEAESGDLLVDTIHEELGSISFLKDRQYNESSYEQMVATESGFTSFRSAYRPENMILHYSPIYDLGWKIALARYDSQVFAQTHELTHRFTIVFSLMVIIMGTYVWMLMRAERRINRITETASDIRKILMETSEHASHIEDAIEQVCLFTQARSAVFFDTDGEKCHCFKPGYQGKIISGENRVRFNGELLKYADELYRTNGLAINVLCIRPNDHLRKTNPNFCAFLEHYDVKEICFAAVTNSANHTAIVGVVNPRTRKDANPLLEKVAVCFSIAFNNKKHLDNTELAATTDPLTGVLNRVAYNKALDVLDQEKTTDFSCIYIDVNELHLINNTYGHSAGDEMLLYIANTLKEVFYGHEIYRLGGDEFLVFVRDLPYETVKKNTKRFAQQLKIKNYHTAIGLSYRTQNTNTDDMVKEAEARMYEAKAQYYQNKEEQSVASFEDKEYVQARTGLLEIDAMIHVLTEHYNGICRVSLETDKASRLLMPAYFGCEESGDHFSALFSKYVSQSVEPDHRRAMLSFLNYDSIKNQLREGLTPKITYKKIGGRTAVLSVHKIGESDTDTLWVFAKA